MDHQTLMSLLEKAENQTATAFELQALDDFYNSFEGRTGYTEYISDQEAYDQLMLVQIKSGIDQRKQKTANKISKLWPRLASAAAAIAMITLGTWLYLDKIASPPGASRNDELVKNDIAPGRNLATLTLANGKVITLDTNKTNVIVADSIKMMTMLTAATPRGGTYQVTLPDSSKVWLNAASKISFPSLFNGIERRISLAGEAYFEVSPDKSRPFIVESTGQEIRVLGTHFNVNAYTDEGDTKTTLLEGSVKVSSGETVLLKPGQQSILSSNALKVHQADVEEDMAWKNGDFVFNGEKIQSIMKKISRWYNIDVEYSGDITDDDLYGKVSRSKNISQVLKALESTKLVQFKIEGRKVIVRQ